MFYRCHAPTHRYYTSCDTLTPRTTQIKPYYDTEEVVVLENYIIVRTCNRILDGQPGHPTNQYTVLSYDTFRMDVYGCEAVNETGAEGGKALAGACVKLCGKCSYQGQCCKYNPKVKAAEPFSTDDECSKHNPLACCPTKLGPCPNPCGTPCGMLGDTCCRSFCFGVCDCIAPDPAGPHSIEFRQYPSAHTKVR